jgi:hypothetical protein
VQIGAASRTGIRVLGIAVTFEGRGAQTLAIEGSVAGQQLVEQYPQRVNVRPRVHVQPAHLRLLRAHVGRRANQLPVGREERLLGQRRLQRLGRPEVNHLGHGFAVVQRDQDVRGLEVAVDDAFLMGMLDGLAHGRNSCKRSGGVRSLASQKSVIGTPWTSSITK